MIRSNRSRRLSLSAPAALLASAGLASSALAVDKSWICNSGTWASPGCWTPVGAPSPADIARLGNAPGVANQTVHLDWPDTVAALIITNGMTFRNDGFNLTVNGATVVSGNNLVDTQVGPTLFRSSLTISEAGFGADYFTNSLTVSDGARINLVGGEIRVEDDFTIDAGAFLVGDGGVEFAGVGATFINNGVINPDASDMRLTQLADGAFDLDGTSGDGAIHLDDLNEVVLTIEGDRLSDDFGGSVVLAAGARLHMDLNDGWAVDNQALFTVYGAVGHPAARITGTPLSFGGVIDVLGDDGSLRIEAATTFTSTARIGVGIDNLFEVTGTTVIDGALFNLAEDARINFNAPTEVRAGTFNSFSTFFTQGYVAFNAHTEWNGDVTIGGIARQLSSASVIGTTVIDADNFDMDGNGTVVWDVNASLTVNADAINHIGNSFAGTMNIDGGLANRVTINLPDPEDFWSASGTLNLEGHASLYFTRIAGSPLLLIGDLNVNSGRVNVSSDITIANSAVVSVGPAAAILRFLGDSEIRSSAEFVGDGAIRNATDSEMLLHDGLGTAGVGLINDGALRIGEAAGMASVDRFENTATGVWQVQIGGHTAGTEYDRLIVAGGPATLAGSIDVELIDVGAGVFQPQVGDTFTVLTAVGGVAGAFASEAVSNHNGVEYRWIVSSNPVDVTITLDRVIAACPADFNADGTVNSQDFFDFLTAFFASSASADINDDATVNSQDFFDFLTAFFGGC